MSMSGAVEPKHPNSKPRGPSKRNLEEGMRGLQMLQKVRVPFLGFHYVFCARPLAVQVLPHTTKLPHTPTTACLVPASLNIPPPFLTPAGSRVSVAKKRPLPPTKKASQEVSPRCFLFHSLLKQSQKNNTQQALLVCVC